jgi:hypothetical protein
METSIHVLDEQVDLVLDKIARSPTLTLNVHELYDVPFMNENAYQLDHVLLEKGLIKVIKDGRAITGKGLEIANFGGWISYQKQLRREIPRNVFPANIQQRELEKENKVLREEIAKQKNEIRELIEKEVVSMLINNNLIQQNNSSKIVLVLIGIVSGLILSSLLWYVIF